MVGAGLVLTVLDAGVDDAGVATVSLKMTDSMGRALERTGTFTEGPVSASFVLGALQERGDGTAAQYTSYTTRSVTFDGGTFVQNGTDTNGTWTELEPLGSGNYVYRFGTTITVANPALTHTVGIYATRTFDGVRAVDNDVFHFRPDGQPVTVKRDVATTAGCNSCHTRLEAHGGARREVGLCVMCHTATNNIDPESGNTFDFKIMVHQIHRGRFLPSVDAGTPYRFVGFQGAVSDFSDVVFPANISDCESCHTGTDGARWKTAPSAANCSGCHDRTWFASATPPAGFVLHSGGPRADSQCVVCHASGSIEPIDVVHRLRARDPSRLDVTASVLSAQGGPGIAPSVTFRVAVGGTARDVLTQPTSRLRFNFAGPNGDFARNWVDTAETASSCTVVTDGGACLERVDAGVFTWRSAVPLSPSDQGSFTVGVEACVTNDGGVWCAPNAVAPFGVTDATPVARRQSVSVTQCNTCHRALTKHGVAANDTAQCVLCHHANAVEPVVVPASGPAVTAVSLDFKGLIHRLHAAAQYPSPQANCSKCHVGTGGTLPIAPSVLPSRDDTLSCSMAPSDGGTVCDAASVLTNSSFTPPASTACLGCHGSLAAQAHAIINTTSTGAEACAVCHQAGRTAGLDLVHALAP